MDTKITYIDYDSKNKINDLYLHDYNIKEFIYNDLDKYIIMKTVSEYLKKEINFKFINVSLCEINGMERLHDESGDIIDWYELSDEPQLFDYYKDIRPVGIMIVKSSITTIKIYCEKIEVEEKELVK